MGNLKRFSAVNLGRCTRLYPERESDFLCACPDRTTLEGDGTCSHEPHTAPKDWSRDQGSRRKVPPNEFHSQTTTALLRRWRTEVYYISGIEKPSPS